MSVFHRAALMQGINRQAYVQSLVRPHWAKSRLVLAEDEELIG